MRMLVGKNPGKLCHSVISATGCSGFKEGFGTETVVNLYCKRTCVWDCLLAP